MKGWWMKMAVIMTITEKADVCIIMTARLSTSL